MLFRSLAFVRYTKLRAVAVLLFSPESVQFRPPPLPLPRSVNRIMGMGKRVSREQDRSEALWKDLFSLSSPSSLSLYVNGPLRNKRLLINFRTRLPLCSPASTCFLYVFPAFHLLCVLRSPGVQSPERLIHKIHLRSLRRNNAIK